MFITISKSDVLQSIGFAVTAATEEFDRVKSNIADVVQKSLLNGHMISDETQKAMADHLKSVREQFDELKQMERMVQFVKDGEPVFLDVVSFKLIEPNLPAR